jgi:hypothetical protein
MITLDCQRGVAAHRAIQRSILSARPQITGAEEFTPNPARITRIGGDRGHKVRAEPTGGYARCMAGERTYAVLPCADMDDSLQFYGALGFEVTYRQKRPNPYAMVAREEIQIHLAGIDGFDPSQSYGSVIIAVPCFRRSRRIRGIPADGSLP